jgi:hypothetical protein
LALIILLSALPASAEIRHGRDEFTNGTVIGSYINVADVIDSIFLVKTVTSNSSEYEIGAKSKTLKDFAFAKTFIEVKIDENPTHKIEVKGVSSTRVPSSMVTYWFTVVAPANNQIISEIKLAKRVALRFQRVDNYSPIYVLPDAVLAEWKEVIAAEK